MSTARYEVHPSLGAEQAKLPAGSRPSFWHKRAANSDVTVSSEVFTRHESAVRAIRTDVESSAAIFGISGRTFEKLYAPELTYFDVTAYDGQGLPIYEEKPLYPVREVPAASTEEAIHG